MWSLFPSISCLVKSKLNVLCTVAYMIERPAEPDEHLAEQSDWAETLIRVTITFYTFGSNTTTHRRCLPRWIRLLIPLKLGPCSPWWRCTLRRPSCLSAARLPGCHRRLAGRNGSSATLTVLLPNGEDYYSPQQPWNYTRASREADFYAEKLIPTDLCLSRRHLVLRSLRHSQTDTVGQSAPWLGQT